jgi:shikimate dehydrogenase
MDSFHSEDTYTLDDLSHWQRDGTSLAVLGYPVRHSISPAMHNAALDELTRENPQFADWKYFRFEVKPEELLDALPLFYEKRFFGLNLTVPHKEIALPALPQVDPAAKEIGAINTLRRMDTGYIGFNTDGFGLESGIRIELKRELADSEVIILGAGGAGRAAAVQALRSGCRSLTIVNRNPERLAKLIEAINPIAQERTIPLVGKAPDDPTLKIPEGALLINATSLGLKPDDPLPLPANALSKSLALYDMVYNPPQTALMQTIESLGGHAANGLSMLVYQGVRALEIWTDHPVNPDTMDRAARSAIA